jgi:hypothetical protein
VQATVSSYSAGSCSPSKLQGRQVYGIGCALKVTDAYYANADTDYYRLVVAVILLLVRGASWVASFRLACSGTRNADSERCYFAI